MNGSQENKTEDKNKKLVELTDTQLKLIKCALKGASERLNIFGMPENESLWCIELIEDAKWDIATLVSELPEVDTTDIDFLF